MKIELKLNEVLFLMEKMNINSLVGIDSNDALVNKEEAITSLAEKDYLYRKDGEICLKMKVQNLFVCWNSFEYLIQRPVMNTDDRKIFVITDKVYICMFDINGEDIHVTCEFFNENLMDSIITNMLEIKPVECENEFIQNITQEELLNLLDKNVYEVSRKTGIAEETLLDFEDKITNVEPTTMLAFHEDEKVFIKTVQTEKATYLFKDTSYGENQTEKKFTIAKGSTQYIVDSIYNL